MIIHKLQCRMLIQLSQVRRLWPLLVLHAVFFFINFNSFISFGVSIEFIFTKLRHIFIKGQAEAHLLVWDFLCRCVEELLVAFGCVLFFGRVVVSLTYSPFPFSILLETKCLKMSTTCVISYTLYFTRFDHIDLLIFPFKG